MRLNITLLAALLGVALAAGAARGQATQLDKLEGTLRAPAAAAPAAPAAGEAATGAPGYLGVEADETPEMGKGVWIKSVRKGAPSELGGLRDGDIITQIDGNPIRNLDDLDAVLGKSTVGTKLVMKVQRLGVQVTRTITLGRKPAPAAQPATPDPLAAPPRTTVPPAEPLAPREPATAPPTLIPAAPAADPLANPLTRPARDPDLDLPPPPTDPLAPAADPLAPAATDPFAPGPAAEAAAGRATLGISVVPLNAETRIQYDVRATARQGAIIHSVRAGSPADLAGLPIGGVIVSIDGELVKSSDDLAAAVAAGRPGQEVELRYMLEGDRVATKTVKLAPAAATAIVPATPRASERPAVGRFEDTLGLPPERKVPLGSSIADPSRVAELFEEIKALNDQIKALEERIKALEDKPAGEAGGTNP